MIDTTDSIENGGALDGLTTDQKRILLGDALLQVYSLAADIDAANEPAADVPDLNTARRDAAVLAVVRALDVAEEEIGPARTTAAFVEFAARTFRLEI